LRELKGFIKTLKIKKTFKITKGSGRFDYNFISQGMYLLIVFSNTTTVSQQNQAIYHEIVAVKPDLNL